MPTGILSVATSVPAQIRGNDFWRRHYPDLVADAEQQNLAKLWKRREAAEQNSFDQAIEPYLNDPFRGAEQRRILAEGETGLTLEVEAGRRAIEAAGWSRADVDLVLVSSFLPDQFGPGNAAYVVRDLGLSCPGINIESACASALVALNTAVGLIQAKHYRNALVITSCSYSRMVSEDDTLSWFLGDGGGAFALGEVPEHEGWKASHTVHTAATCDTFRLDLVVDEVLGPVPRMAATAQTSRIINETGEGYLRETCDGALRKAGLTTGDIACAVVNTPTAWYADFASRVLGIDREKVVSTYPSYANTGSALMPMNLHASVQSGLLHPGDWVLLYAVGSVSTAVATVLRWGEVALGGD